MAKTDRDNLCDLCGLAVELNGFELNTVEGNKRFCCEGCKSIYQMFNEEKILLENQPNLTRSIYGRNSRN